MNDLVDTLSIAGSPANSMTGFNSFVLTNGDTFVSPLGSQPTVVFVAADADTIVLTPGQAPITINGATVGSVVLDFEGYGAALAGVTQLTADTGQGASGDTVISVPGDGSVTFSRFKFTPATADAEFNIGTPLCFRSGTLIATLTGEVAVENHREGDLVTTAFGEAMPVVWLGRSHINCARHPDPEEVWPVRVSAGTFGPGRSSRDLYLSPNHGVYVGNV